MGATAHGFEEVHGGYGYGDRNVEGERILEFAVANDLLVGNTQFTKRESHLVTYSSGGHKTQIDYILYRKSFSKAVTDVKVIPMKLCLQLQHQLLVCDFRVHMPRVAKRKFIPRLRTWKLRDPAVASEFHEAFEAKVASDANQDSTVDVEELWSKLKNPLLEVATEVCGLSKAHQWKRETWWWSECVDAAVREKRACFKRYNTLMKDGKTAEAEDAKTLYNVAKRNTKHAVWLAQSEAEKEQFADIGPRGEGVFRIAKQMDRTNQDVVGEKCVRNDAGELTLDDEDKTSVPAVAHIPHGHSCLSETQA